ncbi:MAG: hypothetical protein HYV65_02445 [Candidatus Spechtbacteria bacterium]|nr:hypothetical protein [Candidatus Spechtbacteria bacterium]
MEEFKKEDGSGIASEIAQLSGRTMFIGWAVFIVASFIVFVGLQIFTVHIQMTPKFALSFSRNNLAKVAANSDVKTTSQIDPAYAALQDVVLPEDGVNLEVKWNDIGKQMTDSGVIDGPRMEEMYAKRGQALSDEDKNLLYGTANGSLTMNAKNSNYLLNLFWALGLGNKNDILDSGPMKDEKYGGADRFASTGGWTLAKGDAMNHYSHYSFITLTTDQQQMVERVAKGIYRPCCNNPVYFPDCNHGMAMLGLLELMASQGASEDRMYKIALQANSYWFPDTYLTIAQYFSKRGVEWKDVDAKEVLGAAYSSASGSQKIYQEVAPPTNTGGGGSCGA